MTRAYVGAKRVWGWSLALGCIFVLVGIKEATAFGARDLLNIATLFVTGCVFGYFLWLLTTAYNLRRKGVFHIWGWAVLLGAFGLLFNTGSVFGYFLGGLLGAAIGAFLGMLLYFRVMSGKKRTA